VSDQLSLADRAWPLVIRLMSLHVRLYRETGGRIGQRLPGSPPILLLDHTGARSGKRRTTPLVYMPDGENLVVVGAKSGYPKHPSWVHNLRAHPDTEVQVGSNKISVHATEANAEERQLLWLKAVEYNPAWGRYQRRTNRTLPVVILRRSNL
jgi:deazaflavin-dependent oxidoreductase (nitroreductase family)